MSTNRSKERGAAACVHAPGSTLAPVWQAPAQSPDQPEILAPALLPLIGALARFAFKSNRAQIDPQKDEEAQ